MKITLSVQEQTIVEGIALARHRMNIEKGRQSLKVGKGGELQINFLGIGGEFAFCKLKNIFPDMSIDYPLPFDCKIDKIGYIDIKTTIYPNGHLVVGKWKETYSVPAYFALMVGEMPTFELKGFYPGNKMFYPENLKDFGGGLTYAISQDRLIMDI